MSITEDDRWSAAVELAPEVVPVLAVDGGAGVTEDHGTALCGARALAVTRVASLGWGLPRAGHPWAQHGKWVGMESRLKLYLLAMQMNRAG
ncbi:MAG: hypothetical protein AB7I33_08770 [Gemmatimonadales bacterium]